MVILIHTLLPLSSEYVKQIQKSGKNKMSYNAGKPRLRSIPGTSDSKVNSFPVN